MTRFTDSATVLVPEPAGVAELQSRVLFSPADEMLGNAIAETLEAPPAERAALFTRLIQEILHFVRENPGERDWSCAFYEGVDESAIFRGGHGHSLVIDPAGRLWRARSYEDFETTYAFAGTSCEIATLNPLYAQMREYKAQR